MKTIHKCRLLLAAIGLVIVHGHVFAVQAFSKVSAQTLVLELKGATVEVDVYPPTATPTGAAILAHGGFRNRKTMAEHAQALAARGVLALAPNLPCWFDHRCNARAIAELVHQLRGTETFGPRVQRVILVGFSAGGLSSLLAADTPGVVGFVGLDSFDQSLPNSSENLGLAAASRLATETLLMRAPASRCNAYSASAPWSSQFKSLWRDDLIAGASHCDFEAPTDWMCRLACGETDAFRQALVRQGLLDAASRWLP